MDPGCIFKVGWTRNVRDIPCQERTVLLSAEIEKAIGGLGGGILTYLLLDMLSLRYLSDIQVSRQLDMCLSLFGPLSHYTTHWAVYKQQKFISHSSCPRSGCQLGQMRAVFQVTDFLLYPHMVEGVRDLSGASFIRPFIPFLRASS